VEVGRAAPTAMSMMDSLVIPSANFTMALDTFRNTGQDTNMAHNITHTYVRSRRQPAKPLLPLAPCVVGACISACDSSHTHTHTPWRSGRARPARSRCPGAAGGRPPCPPLARCAAARAAARAAPPSSGPGARSAPTPVQREGGSMLCQLSALTRRVVCVYTCVLDGPAPTMSNSAPRTSSPAASAKMGLPKCLNLSRSIV
jgi:hypothetical protein